jgi:hypothetical protein
MTAPNNHEEEHPMNTKSIPSAQAQTQHLVLRIDEKWCVRYDPANNDQPTGTLRYGDAIPAGTTAGWNNDVVAMFYALLARSWRPISSAPVGDAAACIDVWCGDYDHRVTDCFWDAQIGGWCYEFFNDNAGEYRAVQVKNPTHWMHSPTRPAEA